MNKELLKKHVREYLQGFSKNPSKLKEDLENRNQRKDYYGSWTEERILRMRQEDLSEYISKLWAMLIWGNKQYVVDKLCSENGLEKLRKELASLIWGKATISERWDAFRKTIKGMGPAMISELLCYTHPHDCMVWNRRAYVGLRYLGVGDIPRYDYQLKGVVYERLSNVCKEIARELEVAGLPDQDLLTVDYFMWDQLQVEENLSQIHHKKAVSVPIGKADDESAAFVHNDIRDKIADIGAWLGFKTQTEVKVADGSVVDTVWEATIGNMGRVIYVFEVQTKGSIDSLLMNLLKATNNPAVQGIVAVSDGAQIDKIRKEASATPLNTRLRCWDYEEVLSVYENFQSAMEAINRLNLVPEGFSHS